MEDLNDFMKQIEEEYSKTIPKNSSSNIEIEGEAKEIEGEAKEIKSEPNPEKVYIREVKKPKNKIFKKGLVFASFLVLLNVGVILGGAYYLLELEDKIRQDVLEEIKGQKIIPTSANVKSGPSNIGFADMVEVVKPSVVTIAVNVEQQVIENSYYEEWFEEFFPKKKIPQENKPKYNGFGTGVIIKELEEKVYIVTNNHVVQNANEVAILLDGANDYVNAKLVGEKYDMDLAVVAVSKKDLEEAGVKNIVTANFGNSDDLRVGDFVIAIGNALGEGISTTSGMVSIKDKVINIDGRELKVLQTDAAINPGNSGGPLINGYGEVIGINTAKLMQSSNEKVEGMGYSLKSNEVEEVVKTIMENANKPFLGIKGGTFTEEMAKAYNLPAKGVFVSEVIEGGKAIEAGIKSGDIITSFAGETISSMETLSTLIKSQKLGDTVEVKVLRDEKLLIFNIKMEAIGEIPFN